VRESKKKRLNETSSKHSEIKAEAAWIMCLGHYRGGAKEEIKKWPRSAEALIPVYNRIKHEEAGTAEELGKGGGRGIWFAIRSGDLERSRLKMSVTAMKLMKKSRVEKSRRA